MAIARDATSSGTSASGATSVTVSHTCTGSNLILWVAVLDQGGDTVTGVTYNGAAMTQAVKTATGSAEMYLYYLINPATGANNVVASRTSTTSFIRVGNVSYTGAKQSGQPDATGSQHDASGTSTSTSVTTIADNCWAILAAAGGGSETASTNATLAVSVVDGFKVFDNQTNGAITPAGAFSMTFTHNSGAADGIVASFAPPTGTNTSGFFGIL